MGIDPGRTSGGIVILNAAGGVFEAHVMPNLERLKAIALWCDSKERNVKVILEDVQPDYKWHIKSASSFFKHIGQLELLFPDAMLVNPKVWQSAVVPKFLRGDAKMKSLGAAKIYWPEMNWVQPGKRVAHDGICDAALIAKYGLDKLKQGGMDSAGAKA